jgi:ankyrin repeat protein
MVEILGPSIALEGMHRQTALAIVTVNTQHKDLARALHMAHGEGAFTTMIAELACEPHMCSDDIGEILNEEEEDEEKAKVALSKLLDKQVEEEEMTESTMIHLAAERGIVELMEVIVDLESVEACRTLTPDKNNAVHLAAQHGHAQIIDMVLRKPKDMSVVYNEENYRPSHVAAMHDHVHCLAAMQFVDQYASMNVSNSSSQAPIHLAIVSDHAECFDVLISPYDNRVWTIKTMSIVPHIFDIFTECMNLDSVKCLQVLSTKSEHLLGAIRVPFRANDVIAVVSDAAGEGRTRALEIVSEMLTPEVLMRQDKQGCAAVMFAASHGKRATLMRMLQLLGDRAKDAMLVHDIENCSAAMYAAQNGMGDVLDYVFHDTSGTPWRHPDFIDTVTDFAGNNPAHVACKRGNVDAVRLMYDAFGESIFMRRNQHDECPVELVVDLRVARVLHELMGKAVFLTEPAVPSHKSVLRKWVDEPRMELIEFICKEVGAELFLAATRVKDEPPMGCAHTDRHRDVIKMLWSQIGNRLFQVPCWLGRETLIFKIVGKGSPGLLKFVHGLAGSSVFERVRDDNQNIAHFAAGLGSVEMLEMMQQLGLQHLFHARDTYGRTPAELVPAKSCPDALAFLTKPSHEEQCVGMGNHALHEDEQKLECGATQNVEGSVGDHTDDSTEQKLVGPTGEGCAAADVQTSLQVNVCFTGIYV